MSSIVDKIYFNSPVWIQHILVAAWGVGWYYRRFGPLFHKYLNEFCERDRWTENQFREYQTKLLTRVFDVAWESVYYRKIFTDAGIVKEMNPWDAMKRMPILTKEILRTNGDDLLTTSSLPKGTKFFNTSGSTGTPISIPYTPAYLAIQSAVASCRNIKWGGVTEKSRRFMSGGRKVCNFDQNTPPFWRYSPVENLAYGSSYHLSERFLPYYVEFLKKFKPEVIMGYPSSLSIIARYVLEHGESLPPAKLASTSAETVSPEQRSVIQSAWQCKLYDRYGSVEGCIYVGQCEHGRYHISPDIGIVEIVDAKGQPCPPGVPGELVCTGLHNTIQPLIRYRIGDIARWAEDQHCACERHTPILESIEGRVEDMCYTPDGRQMLRFHAVYYGLRGVKQAQVVQETPNQFMINVVATPEFSIQEINTIKSNMRKHVGGDVDVVVMQVPEIQRNKSGKVQAVVCKLSAEQKEALQQKVM